MKHKKLIIATCITALLSPLAFARENSKAPWDRDHREYRHDRQEHRSDRIERRKRSDRHDNYKRPDRQDRDHRYKRPDHHDDIFQRNHRSRPDIKPGNVDGAG